MTGGSKSRAAVVLGTTVLWSSTLAAAGSVPNSDDVETRLARLAMDIHRYRLDGGPRVVLSPDRSASTVAVSVSVANRARGSKFEDYWGARLAYEARNDSLDVRPEVARQLAWRAIDQRLDLSWDFVSFSRTVAAHDLEFGVWSMAEQGRGEPLRALDRLRDTLLFEARRDPEQSRLLARAWLRSHGGTEPGAASLALEALAGFPLEELRALVPSDWHTEDAVLTLSGDFETERARAFVDRHFEQAPPRRKTESSNPGTLAPKGESARRGALPSSTSAALFGFSIPPIDHPDHPALKLLTVLLAERLLRASRSRVGDPAPIRAWTDDTITQDVLTVEVNLSTPNDVSAFEQQLATTLKEIARTPPRFTSDGGSHRQ